MHRPNAKASTAADAFPAAASAYGGGMPDPVDRLRSLIADVPDFPEPGITFRDITPMLEDPAGLALSVELMANPFRGEKIDLVLGAESRGFIFGTAVACCLSAGFGLIRKPGKLPRATVETNYDLEYGSNTMQLHRDAVKPGQRVLIVDDVLATGGTAAACVKLVKELGAEVAAVAVLIELEALDGRKLLGGERVHSVVTY